MKQRINRAAIQIAFFTAIAAAVLTGCPNMNKNGTPSSEAKLLSFAFEKRLNTWLEKDITGVIDESAKTVTVTVPEAAYQQSGGKNRKFKASFTVSPNAKLYKGTAEQKSGELEELFIADKEYRVVAKSASSTYTVCIKITYKKPAVPPELAEDVEKLYGTYRGLLHFDNNHYKTCAVFDDEKAIIYAGPMSSLYVNMEWKKNSESQWVCTTYHKNDFERKNAKNTATFTVGADGKATCTLIVNAMDNAPSKAMKKGADYIFKPDDGEGFKAPTKQ